MSVIPKWRKFSDEELKEIVSKSHSFRELAKQLGYYQDSGGTMRTLHKMVEEVGLDVSHFTGQSWNKDNFNYSRFQYGKNIQPANAIDALISLRGRKCECCGLEIWNNQPIPLEVHHIDGDHLNNNLDNLQILCCNCHALTNNFKGRNQPKTKIVSEEDFVEALKTTPNIRQALLKLGLTSRGHNYDRAYDLLHKYNIKQVQ